MSEAFDEPNRIARQGGELEGIVARAVPAFFQVGGLAPVEVTAEVITAAPHRQFCAVAIERMS